MMKVSNVCVYCGSAAGIEPAFMEEAEKFGRLLGRASVGLVYGGARIGLMGAVARGVLAEGGRVVGVIPDFLRHVEVELREVSEFIVTDSMHERKWTMFERSDAFVALPGGIGTLEETIEMLTWAQLGRHKHPIVLVNLNGFWDPLVALLDHIITSGFSHSNIRSMYCVVDRVEDVLPRIEAEL